MNGFSIHSPKNNNNNKNNNKNNNNNNNNNNIKISRDYENGIINFEKDIENKIKLYSNNSLEPPKLVRQTNIGLDPRYINKY